jgi:hypothetical protein
MTEEPEGNTQLFGWSCFNLIGAVFLSGFIFVWNPSWGFVFGGIAVVFFLASKLFPEA